MLIIDKWNMVEIDGEMVMPFQWRDSTPGGSNLGRAEFQICLKFKRGRIVEYWVYPRQQRSTTCWHYIGSNIDFHITAYDGLRSEGAWLISWCKEHKTFSFSVYAPTDAKYLRMHNGGIAFLKESFGEPVLGKQ